MFTHANVLVPEEPAEGGSTNVGPAKENRKTSWDRGENDGKKKVTITATHTA